MSRAHQDLEDFAYWLRVGDTSKVISLQRIEAKRSEKSINRAITAVSTFYDYHLCNKTVDFRRFERFHAVYKTGNSRVGTTGILTGIAKAKSLFLNNYEVSSQKARGWSPRKVRLFDRDCFGDHPLALVSFWDNEFDPGRNRVSGPNSMGMGTPLPKRSTDGESKERLADG